VLCELDANIVACQWDSSAGVLQPIQSVYTLADGQACSRAHHSGCAHILVNAAGSTLYSSGRTTNEICVCAIDPATGRLTKLQSVSTAGISPRNFHLDEDVDGRGGGWLRVANQDTQNVVSYAIVPGGGGRLDKGSQTVLDLGGLNPAVVTVPRALAVAGSSL
jgi:6-phosphogluconolactonase